jgi:hypothetical protein
MRHRNRRILILLIVVLIVAGGVWFVGRRHIVGIRTTSEKRTPSLRDFQSLPYLTHVEDDAYSDLKGVTLYNDTLSFAGLNLLTSVGVGGAHLLDMEGRVLHSWYTCDSLGDRWFHSEMDPYGNLTALVIGVGLVKMDWDSRVVWISKPSENPYLKGSRPKYHHDFEITESGDIYVLAQGLSQLDIEDRNPTESVRRRPGLSTGRVIRHNSIMILSPDGIGKASMPLYDLVGEAMSTGIQAYVAESERSPQEKGNVIVSPDVFHANTVEELPRDIAVAKKGDVLLCIRNLDFIGIFRVETGDLLWSWGPGILEHPHHPTVLESGNILVFDNGGRERAYSRILELNPGTNEIVWQYVGEPPESFFASVMGASQRLPNGNTLITESTAGRVFEVTQDGEITWQFLNFEVSTKAEGKGKRATIYRMVRYNPEYLKRPIGDRTTGL